MSRVGLVSGLAGALCWFWAVAQDAPSVTDPAEKAVAQEAAPAPAEPKPKPTMPDVPKEVLETPAPMPEVSVPPEVAAPSPAQAPAPEPAPAPAPPPAPEPAPPPPAPAPEPAPPPAPAPEPAPAPPSAPLSAFERVFGDAVKLDPPMVQKVLADEAGKRHYVDLNQDGKPEEVWFVDTASRHPADVRPVLVRAIDEDGDLQNDTQADQDSDLYVADWHADGTVDAVVDYTDTDHDQDLDEMGIYALGTAAFGGEGSVVVWWSNDVGDDNLLWYDVGYAYDRALCQYHCHFGGNEMFCALMLPPGAAAWQTGVENPFAFYDLDGDGITEETIRFESDGSVLKTMRHSFDADNDATAESPRDYDVSITAIAAGAGVPIDPASTQQIQLRGIPAGPVLNFAAEQTAGQAVAWDRMLFTWDEDDNNVDGQTYADTDERWEGVIAQGADGFPQVGEPSCGPVNKRYELAVQTGAPANCYFHPVDQRIHLYRPQRAWMDVDADQDRTADMKYSYADSDGDGIVDTWNLDIDADGTVDDSWQAAGAAVRDVAWNWPAVNAAQHEALVTGPPALFALTQRLEQAIKAAGADPNADPVLQLIRVNFTAPAIGPDLRRKFIDSDETMRFYLDLLKDRLIFQLKGLAKDAAFWPAFNEARGRGDLAAMQAQLEQAYTLAEPLAVYADWVGAKRAEVDSGPRVAYAQDWISDHIGWESEAIAYRAYYGQIDVYGKSHDGFILGLLKDDEQAGDWGVDALHVRDTAGCGGVTLYINGQPYPAWGPQGKGFVTVANSLVEQADDHVTVEITASNVGPEGGAYTVHLRCTILADHRDTKIDFSLEGGKPEDALELGINLTRLTEQPFFTVDQQAGIMAVRGYQSSTVGTIGLGVVYPPARFLRMGDAPSENQIVLSIDRATPLTYHVQADWVRGRRFPVAPSDADWMNELRALAASLGLK